MTSIQRPDRPACQHCLHFNQSEQTGHGDCHRYPPLFAGDSSPNEKHRWKHPIVSLTDWCGEFTQNPALTA